MVRFPIGTVIHSTLTDSYYESIALITDDEVCSIYSYNSINPGTRYFHEYYHIDDFIAESKNGYRIINPATWQLAVMKGYWDGTIID